MPTPRDRHKIEPVAEAIYRISFEASRRVKEKLDLARALSSHSNPAGKLEIIFEQALDLWLDKVQARRFATSTRPRDARATATATATATALVRAQKRAGSRSAPTVPTSGAAATSGTAATVAAETTPGSTAGTSPTAARGRRRAHIPHSDRREVAERDGMQCTFTAVDGCRCTARAFTQFHHEAPWARGGRDETGNLRLLCASHNRLLAECDFGARHIAERISKERGGAGP